MGALEQLDVLLALRKASTGDVRRRKRKADDELEMDTKPKTDTKKGRSPSKQESSHFARIKSQLPLLRGRKVAFCQALRGEHTHEEEWIMATVISTIQGDKMRYIVQDAEDDTAHGPYVSALLMR